MTTGRDLLYAIRGLTRTPAFTLPAVASLALGIAVNTTMFSLVNALLFKPLAGPQSQDLVRVGRSMRGDGSFRSASYEEYVYLREHASSLDDLMGEQLESVAINWPDGSDLASAELVTTNYFSILRVPPLVGSTFMAAGDRASGQGSTLVLSHQFWRDRFGGEPSIVGRAVRVNGRPFTVIGVAPPGFHGTFPGVDIDLWLPAVAPETGNARPDGRGEWSLMLVGRLREGISLSSARAELEMLAGQMAERLPGRDRARGFVIAPARGAHPAIAALVRGFFLLLMGAVAIVLLIACANVASLLLARASARQRELGIRLAYGATRREIMTQLLIESGLVATLGAGGGLILTFWSVRLLSTLSMVTGPTGAPVFLDWQIDGRVLLFTAIVAVLTALMFGIAPAIQATRVDILPALRDSRTFPGGRSRLRGALTVVQVTASFVLLVAGLQLFRSVRATASLDLGFDPDRVVLVSFDLETLGYERSRADAFFAELLRRARGLPGVEHAAFADFIPMGDRGTSIGVTIPGLSPPVGQEQFRVAYNRVSDGYFSTIRHALVRGREFTPRDGPGAPHVAIVNDAMARHFWPGEDPLGQRVQVEGEPLPFEIVGVARDAMYASYLGAIRPLLYLPARQYWGPLLTLHVRTSLPPLAAIADIRRLSRDIDQNVAPYNGRAMREGMAPALVPARIAQGVFGVAGVIALLLAAGGLYGLVCYTLERRLKDIGIRVALGATRRSVFGFIVGNTLRLAIAGIAVGVAIAAATMRLLSSLLFGLSPTDPLTFGGVAALLALVTLAAGYAAARKGLGVDPMVVLRHE